MAKKESLEERLARKIAEKNHFRELQAILDKYTVDENVSHDLIGENYFLERYGSLHNAAMCLGEINALNGYNMSEAEMVAEFIARLQKKPINQIG